MVNNLGGLSFLELGIIADATVRSLGEPHAGIGPPDPRASSCPPFEAGCKKSTRDSLAMMVWSMGCAVSQAQLKWPSATCLPGAVSLLPCL